jgi:hypothetical protein
LNARQTTSRAASPLLLPCSTRADVSPEVAHRHALLRRDGLIFSPPMVRLWYAAEDAAVRAACGSWRDAPLAAALEWEP